MTKLALIIPCYNESECIDDTIIQLSEIVVNLSDQNLISSDSFILFVDDGSKDDTFFKLSKAKSSIIKIMRLSNNRGHQYALLAGLHFVHNKVDCAISIDADLQDDLTVIGQMIAEFHNGYHIICGVRSNRKSDSMLKRKSASLFYFLMSKLGVNLIKNHADFRLLSNHAISELMKYEEYNLFLRGIFPVINIKLKTIEYTQNKRLKGDSKCNLRKMFSLAIHGITSFSTIPIRIISFLGLLIFVVCILLSVNVLFIYISSKTVPGWASITLPLYFLGGVQMLSLGIIGEYLSKMYQETKRRPHYHI